MRPNQLLLWAFIDLRLALLGHFSFLHRSKSKALVVLRHGSLFFSFCFWECSALDMEG